jgi:serine/threonine protein kinase
MSGESELLEVAAKVADGASIDWEALERQAANDHERRILESLRLLSQVGTVHDSTESPESGARAADETIGGGRVATPVPRQWGRYEVRGRIGEGAQGTVYRAWDPQLECEVALKVLQPQHATSDRVGERMLREGRVLARVRHPHVVDIYAAEVHEGQVGLCMEFIRGRTLEDLLSDQGPLGPQEAVAIGVAVGRALVAVHGAGLVHRDVKTRNVMREEKGRIVLMDFGTGRDYEQLAKGGGELAGTPLYMAPELLSGSGASQQSDIYSLGVLLYHLVTAGYPIEGETFEEIIKAHQTGKRTPLAERRPDLPGDFIRIIDRATAADPAARHGSVALLVHELLSLDSVPDPLVPPPPVWQRLLNGAAWLTGTAIALVLLGFLNSTELNVMLERSDFVSESPLDWLRSGLQALVGPFGELVQVVILGLAAVFIWRLVRRFSPSVDRWSIRVAAAVRAWLVRIGFEDSQTFAQLVFVIGLAYMGLVIAIYHPLIGAAMNPVSQLTPAQREIFSPTNESSHELYREMLDVLVFGTGLAIYRLVRKQRRSDARNTVTLIAPVAAIFLLAVVLWDGPYKVLFQNRFKRVEFEQQRCYELGADSSETLLYCPDGPQPTVRRVPAGDSRVTDTGITESIFTPR